MLENSNLFCRGTKTSAIGWALALARELRAAGLTVALDDSGAAFGKQFKRADRSGARWALALGDQEAEAEGGAVRLKPLQQQGEETSWAINAIGAIVAVMQTR